MDTIECNVCRNLDLRAHVSHEWGFEIHYLDLDHECRYCTLLRTVVETLGPMAQDPVHKTSLFLLHMSKGYLNLEIVTTLADNVTKDVKTFFLYNGSGKSILKSVLSTWVVKVLFLIRFVLRT